MALNNALVQSFDPAGYQPPSGPLMDLVPVTPSDTVDLPLNARAVYLTVGGVLEFLTHSNVIRNVTLPAGFHPIVCKRIRSTNTSATGIYVGI